MRRCGRLPPGAAPIARPLVGGRRPGRGQTGLVWQTRPVYNKPKKLALVATARKILVWAWAVFREQTPFDAQRAAAA